MVFIALNFSDDHLVDAIAISEHDQLANGIVIIASEIGPRYLNFIDMLRMVTQLRHNKYTTFYPVVCEVSISYVKRNYSYESVRNDG